MIYVATHYIFSIFVVIEKMVAIIKIICIIKEYCILIISFTFLYIRVFTCNSITWHPIVTIW